jgi:hypothetical protein
VHEEGGGVMRTWTRRDTIRMLLRVRRSIGFDGWLEMVSGLAAFAIAWAIIERII